MLQSPVNDVLKWVLIAVQIPFLLMLLRRTWNRENQIPAFTVYLLASVTVASSYDVMSPEWRRNTFVQLEPAFIIVRVIICLESFNLLAQTWKRHFTRCLLIGVSLMSAVAAAAFWLTDDSLGRVQAMRSLRAAEYVGLSAGMILVQAFSLVCRRNFYACWHSGILTLQMTEQATWPLLRICGFLAVPQAWLAAETSGYILATLYYSAWLWASWRYGRPLPGSTVGAGSDRGSGPRFTGGFGFGALAP